MIKNSGSYAISFAKNIKRKRIKPKNFVNIQWTFIHSSRNVSIICVFVHGKECRICHKDKNGIKNPKLKYRKQKTKVVLTNGKRKYQKK